MKSITDSANAPGAERARGSGVTPRVEVGVLGSLRDDRRTSNRAAPFVNQESPQSPPVAANRLWLVDVAGFFYVISMHKFAMRDPLSAHTGIQGIIEILGIGGAFVAIFTATWKARRKHAASIAAVCFVMFGLFALCSSWRSWDPNLSFVKGLLLLVVLVTGYLANQTGLGQRYFRAIYWSYVAMLVIGLIVGVIFPHQYPLISAEEYTGRTRLSVFDTFAGVMGEDATLLLLLAPLIRSKLGWVSQVFLFLIVVFAGGKTSTALLCILLLIRFLFGIRQWRSWRTVAVILAIACVVTIGLDAFLGSGSESKIFAHSAESIYGTKVAGEVSSLDGRLPLWDASLKMLQTAQFLGYGFEGAREVMLSVASWSGNSHNGYLELALTGGIVGFSFFLCGLLCVIGACLRANFPFNMRASLIILSILITDFLGSTFSVPSYFGLLILLWLYYEAKADAWPVHQAPVLNS